jgi:protein-tyrosine phosphatase
MCEVARAAGYPIDDLRARQVDRSDFFEFDWILAMDRQNQRDLLALQATFGGKAKIRLLLDGAPDGIYEVPDPYGGAISDFQDSFSLIRSGVRAFLAHP